MDSNKVKVQKAQAGNRGMGVRVYRNEVCKESHLM
jgi:hypothetical protein